MSDVKKRQLTSYERFKYFRALSKRWQDPVKRIEDIFNVRKADGTLAPLIVPLPQRKILRDGILCRGKKLLHNKQVVRRVINKGRQIGYSIIQAAEAILIAETYPHTNQYYVAATGGQAEKWLAKLTELCKNANHYPPEVGGGEILHLDNLDNSMFKKINGSFIVGFKANPAGMKGETAINVILDEFDWMIMEKNQQSETYATCKHFVTQGGQLNLQSTPRTTNSVFMNIFGQPDKYGFISYYCPTIENWQKLNLNEPFIIELNNKKRAEMGFKLLDDAEIVYLKNRYVGREGFVFDEKNNCIKQQVICHYSWKSIQELEKDRVADLEMFKRENLGIAIDERFKVLKSEWLFNNLVDGDNWKDRKDSFNPFVFGIDIAKQSDLFVITVFEKVDNHWFMRRTEIMPPGQNYTISAQRIVELYDDFKPIAIRVDNTGGGIPFCDMLEVSKCKGVLQRVNFNSGSKTNMAENLRNLARENQLHLLNYNDEHKTVINHLLKVERKTTETTTQYTGKGVDQEGRDDGFWSVALAVCDNPGRDEKVEAQMIKAGFGSVKSRIGNNSSNNEQVKYMQIKKELGEPKKDLVEEQKANMMIAEERKRNKVAFDKLKVGVIPCPLINEMVAPLKCIGCNKNDCGEWSYCNGICESLKINKESLINYVDEVSKNG